ncbi:MAG: hypothetical protein JST70_11925 [Bacteroidetes bacterium]|nr:hypothetical protein [Bacteroidota bacterium]
MNILEGINLDQIGYGVTTNVTNAQPVVSRKLELNKEKISGINNPIAISNGFTNSGPWCTNADCFPTQNSCFFCGTAGPMCKDTWTYPTF